MKIKEVSKIKINICQKPQPCVSYSFSLPNISSCLAHCETIPIKLIVKWLWSMDFYNIKQWSMKPSTIINRKKRTEIHKQRKETKEEESLKIKEVSKKRYNISRNSQLCVTMSFSLSNIIAHMYLIVKQYQPQNQTQKICFDMLH